MYQKSFELAGQTYKQGADIMLGGNPAEVAPSGQEPVEGEFINGKEGSN
jgi:hypothetical protein